MNILIVEDELLIAEMLKEMLFDLGYNNVCISKSFNEAKLKLITHNNIDLAFLDINLTDIKSGIDVANFIKKTCNIPFVYLTSYSDPKTVKQATETLPEAYLLKPFIKSNLFSTLELIKVKHEINSSKSIIIKYGNDTVKLSMHELLFVKSEKNYLNVFTTTKRYVIRQSIDNFIIELNDQKFIRIHRSYAININKIEKIMGSTIKIKNLIIPISRNYKKEILSKFE